jgi:hypothetical protein
MGGAAELGDRGRLALRPGLGDEGPDVVAEPVGELGRPVAASVATTSKAAQSTPSSGSEA